MNSRELVVVKYKEEYETVWDDFVNNGIFGTVHHTRAFMNYHPSNRFMDHSILIYYKQELICVVPACKRHATDVCYFSYLGATYGGPVFSNKYCATKYLLPIIDVMLDHYENKIEFRLANNIYFKEDIFILYCILGNRLTMVPELSWYVNTNEDFINNITNKRNKSNLIKIIKNTEIHCEKKSELDDYMNFYTMLNDGLNARHDTTPTHTREEFIHLSNILQDKQALYLVKQNNDMILGGVYVIKVTSQCWYTFYISKNIHTDNHAAILYLMYTIHADAKKEGVPLLDYGITTENRGKNINIGLADFKQNSLGGTSNARYLFVR